MIYFDLVFLWLVQTLMGNQLTKDKIYKSEGKRGG